MQNQPYHEIQDTEKWDLSEQISKLKIKFRKMKLLEIKLVQIIQSCDFLCFF